MEPFQELLNGFRWYASYEHFSKLSKLFEKKLIFSSSSSCIVLSELHLKISSGLQDIEIQNIDKLGRWFGLS